MPPSHHSQKVNSYWATTWLDTDLRRPVLPGLNDLSVCLLVIKPKLGCKCVSQSWLNITVHLNRACTHTHTHICTLAQNTPTPARTWVWIADDCEWKVCVWKDAQTCFHFHSGRIENKNIGHLQFPDSNFDAIRHQQVGQHTTVFLLPCCLLHVML